MARPTSVGEFDFWLGKELPGTPPAFKDGGEFDYWDHGAEGGGDLPPPTGGGGGLPEAPPAAGYILLPLLGVG